MKRVLVVAEERAITRFVAESLLGRSLEAFIPQPDDPWDVARAHTALEAEVLVTRGRRRFHAIIVDRVLPDQTPVALVERLRRTERAETTPVFLIVERGREPHARRTATEHLHVAGFIERPMNERALHAALELLERPRRVMIVDPDPDRSRRYGTRCERRGFEVITASTPEGAMRALRSFAPDVAAVALSVDSHGGLGVCADIKRSRREVVIPVLLYGHLAALPRGASRENALRADDFVPAPFDDEVLAERIVAQVGYGAFDPAAVSDSGDEPLEESDDLPTRPGPLPETPRAERAPPPKPAPPPRSAPVTPEAPSPAVDVLSQRQSRRVPCETSLRVQDGDLVLQSKTMDISPGGLFFEMQPPLASGTRVDLTFVLPDDDRRIDATGRVAWTGSEGVGVKFTRIERSDLVAIVEYVNRVSKVLYAASS